MSDFQAASEDSSGGIADPPPEGLNLDIECLVDSFVAAGCLSLFKLAEAPGRSKDTFSTIHRGDGCGKPLSQTFSFGGTIRVIEGGVAAAAFLPGQSRLALVQDAGSVLLFDAATSNPAQLETAEGALGAAWAPDGRWLVIAYRDGKIRLVDDTGRISGVADCACRPGGLWPMGRSGMLRLQESAKQQIFVVHIEDGAIQFSMLPGQEQELH